jgi:hypothetical protein
MRALSYEAFGEAFILAAVTPERVVHAVASVAGDSVVLGPLRAGPGRTASVKAAGRIGEPVAEELPGDDLAYSVILPVELDIEVRVGAIGHFRAEGEIELRLAVKTIEPLAILIDVEQARPEDARFSITAHGVQSRLLQRAGDVAGELRQHAASYVNQKLADADARRYMRIDLLPLIEQAWGGL